MCEEAGDSVNSLSAAVQWSCRAWGMGDEGRAVERRERDAVRDADGARAMFVK